MVKRCMSWAIPVILCALAGCNGLAGIREGVFDPCFQDAGDPACVASTASSSAGATSGSSSATTGGAGGFRSKCGNGVVDLGEECDDQGSGEQGCKQCVVECSEPGAFKDPATFHCYWPTLLEMSFAKSGVSCQSYPGGGLATVTSASELDEIASRITGPAWIGAMIGPKGELVWLDHEPWSFQAWGPGEPSKGSKDLCLMLGGAPLLFGMDDCDVTRASLCERGP
jgi:hypothetical protein